MPLSTQFLDQLRDRTALSVLIGGAVKLSKAGREHKGCCPFHHEKSPSFTVNDAKGFYHCFGCGAHGDAIRWMTDYQGLEFLDAVRELADAAGLDMPARDAVSVKREAQRAEMIGRLRPALEAAQSLYEREMASGDAAQNVQDYLRQRGIDSELAAQFGLGYAPDNHEHLRGLNLTLKVALEAGLAWRSDDGNRHGARFRGRVMVPVHDARGRIIAFGGRILPPSSSEAVGQTKTPSSSEALGQINPRSSSESAASGSATKTHLPKYINSSETPLFDKGRVLFNLHRAAPLARAGSARGGSGARLVVVEGYMDVIGMAAGGIGECVAPMGTALTIEQLQQCWRINVRPILLFDGDAAGRKAALRACMTALPMLGDYAGGGGMLAVATLPDGMDPDDVMRGPDGAVDGRAAIEATLSAARGAHDYIFDAMRDEMAAQSGGDASPASPPAPEMAAQMWHRLEAMARDIADDETSQQYMMVWRARYEREVSFRGFGGAQTDSQQRATPHPLTPSPEEEGEISPPSDLRSSSEPAASGSATKNPAIGQTENSVEARLIAVVRHLVGLKREEQAFLEPLREERRNMRAAAKTMGFDLKTIDAAIKAIMAEPAAREESEAMLALYRRVLGISGPLDEAILPVYARPIGVSANGQNSDKMIAAPTPQSAGGINGAMHGASAANQLAWHDAEIYDGETI